MSSRGVSKGQSKRRRSGGKSGHSKSASKRGATVTPVEEARVVLDSVRVNGRLLLGSAVLLAAVGASLYFLHEWQVRRNANAFLVRAEALTESGDYGEALRQYRMYRTYTPLGAVTPELNVKMGRLHVRRGGPGDRAAALKLFERALREEPTLSEVRAEVAELQMQEGRYRDALVHLDELIAAGADDAARLQATAADCLVRLNLPAEALPRFVDSFAADPAAVGATAGLARILLDSNTGVPSVEEVAQPDKHVSTAEQFQAAAKRVLPDATESDATTAEKAAANAIRLLEREGRPRWQAMQEAARFASTDSGLAVDVELDASTAGRRADTVLSNADRNADGVITGDEYWNKDVPTWSDFDGDGRTTREELRERFVDGEIVSRLRIAENRAEAAVAAAMELEEDEPTPDFAAADQPLLSSIRTAAEVAIAAADALRFRDPDASRQSVLNALELARREAELAGNGPSVAAQEATLSLRALAFEPDAARRAETLETIASRLEEAIQSLDTEEGEKPELEDAIYRGPLLWLLADTEMFRAESEPADSERRADLIKSVKEKRIPELETTDSPRRPYWAAYLRGRIAYMERKWADAEIQLRRADSGAGADPDFARRVLLLRADTAGRLQNHDSRISYIQDLLRDDSYWPAARRALANALADAGRFDDAVREFARFARLPGFREAFFNSLISREAGKPPSRQAWGAVENDIDRLTEAEELTAVTAAARVEVKVRQAFKAQSVATDDGISKAGETRFEEARSLIEDSVEKFPDDIRLRVAAVMLEARDFTKPPAGRSEAAREVLVKAKEDLGDLPELRRVAATVAVLSPPPVATEYLDELVEDVDKFSADERAAIFSQVARALTTVGESAEGIELLREASALTPADVRINGQLLESLMAKLITNEGDEGETGPIWDEGLARMRASENENGPFGNYYTAARLILSDKFEETREESLDEAERLLLEAQRSRPTLSSIPRMLGELETRRGNEEAAIPHFEEAMELGDFDESVVARVAVGHSKAGRKIRAKSVVERVAGRAPNLLEGSFGRTAWLVRGSLADDDVLLSVMRDRTREGGDAPSLLLMAADAEARGDLLGEVENLYRSAANAAPESPQAWAALIGYLARDRQPDAALEAMRTAREALAEKPPHVIALMEADGYVRLRNVGGPRRDDFAGSADAAFRDAIESSPEGNHAARVAFVTDLSRIGRYDEALEHLAPLLSEEGRIAWRAKLQKALIKGSTGDKGDVKEAMSLLESLLADGEDTVSALRAKLAVQTANGFPIADRLKTLQALRDESRGRLRASEWQQLAAFSEQRGQLLNAEKAYEDWVETGIAEADALALQADFLLRKLKEDDKPDLEISQAINRLENLEPSAYRTAALKARRRDSDGQSNLAAVELRDFVLEFARSRRDDVFAEVAAADSAEAAIAAIESSSVRRERTVESTVRAAKRLLEDDRPEDALKILKRLPAAEEAVRQVRVEAVRNAAELAEKFGENTISRELFRRYAELADRPEVDLAHAKHLALTGHADDALEMLSRLIEKDRVPIAATAELAAAILRENPRTRRGHLENFRERLDAAAAETDDRDAQQALLFNVAALHDLAGDYPAAEDAFTRVLQISPSNAAAGNNLVFMRARRGVKLPEQVALSSTLIQTHGQLSPLLDTRAVALTASGRAAEAVTILETILPQAKGDAAIRLHLAEAYAASGDANAASRTLQPLLTDDAAADDFHPLDAAAFEKLRDTLKR